MSSILILIRLDPPAPLSVIGSIIMKIKALEIPGLRAERFGSKPKVQWVQLRKDGNISEDCVESHSLELCTFCTSDLRFPLFRSEKTSSPFAQGLGSKLWIASIRILGRNLSCGQCRAFRLACLDGGPDVRWPRGHSVVQASTHQEYMKKC